ncbi:hypothetical protein C8P67_11739 [Flavobacterium aquicola]|uniref:Uncharacterized protein n=1 Tax=Flavobacterium aquicola TaxID=1682742 RepID=A0A3E0DYW8_9FLAO|nr:hypothetical protein C8P67_11739 [Flavobacterium aquicola]
MYIYYGKRDKILNKKYISRFKSMLNFIYEKNITHPVTLYFYLIII